MVLIEKAKELGREIKNSTEYQEMKKKEQGLSEDPQAKEILEELQQVQQQLEAAQNMGMQPGQEQMDKFNELRQQMHQNDTVSAFAQAQQELNELMKQVNDAITQGIEESSEKAE